MRGRGTKLDRKIFGAANFQSLSIEADQGVFSALVSLQVRPVTWLFDENINSTASPWYAWLIACVGSAMFTVCTLVSVTSIYACSAVADTAIRAVSCSGGSAL